MGDPGPCGTYDRPEKNQCAWWRLSTTRIFNTDPVQHKSISKISTSARGRNCRSRIRVILWSEFSWVTILFLGSFLLSQRHIIGYVHGHQHACMACVAVHDHWSKLPSKHPHFVGWTCCWQQCLVSCNHHFYVVAVFVNVWTNCLLTKLLALNLVELHVLYSVVYTTCIQYMI